MKIHVHDHTKDRHDCWHSNIVRAGKNARHTRETGWGMFETPLECKDGHTVLARDTCLKTCGRPNWPRRSSHPFSKAAA
ncbi:MAG: hypothetical protein HKM02_03210 [Pseudomonadales bacterium]|nr:hypothetical protein [Pseudomonadales bacterium]